MLEKDSVQSRRNCDGAMSVRERYLPTYLPKCMSDDVLMFGGARDVGTCNIGR